MGKMEGLRAGIAEMRSVAQRLNQWADDLEASFQGEKAGTPEVSASGQGPAEKKKRAGSAGGPDSGAVSGAAAAPGTEKALTLPEVRAVLAEKCAAGFGTQVRALIESYGASTLKEVPAGKYGELLEAVAGLGGDADAG